MAYDRGPEAVPLIRLEYRGGEFWVCPQRLPVLIHDPTRLTGRLPGWRKCRIPSTGTERTERLPRCEAQSLRAHQTAIERTPWTTTVFKGSASSPPSLSVASRIIRSLVKNHSLPSGSL